MNPLLIPSWLLGYAFMTMFAYLAQFFICEIGIPNTTGGFILTMVNFFTFNGCPGLPDWMPFSLFMMFTFPWFIIAFWMISPVFNNAVTGAFAGVTMLAILINALGLALAGPAGDTSELVCRVLAGPLFSWLFC